MQELSSKDHQLLQTVVWPWGDTMQKLAEYQLFFALAQIPASEFLYPNMNRFFELRSALYDAHPPELLSLDPKDGQNVYCFGSQEKNNLRLDELKQTLVKYHDFISGQEVKDLESAFWRASYASRCVLVQAYFVDPLTRGAMKAFNKYYTLMERQKLSAQVAQPLEMNVGSVVAPNPLSSSVQSLPINARNGRDAREKQFKLEIDDRDSDEEQGYVFWKVQSFNMAEKLFEVVLDECEVLHLDQKELVDLLLTSEMLAK
ncbi:hypothetical protein BT96DRAFT_969673 [Gymnopus androsaceus JB14]|uniref:Uncharacterized protein n=1 Tax=Gymnopus androsaceus JB14 TaxID=1447944 RepID=A0A6A4IM20_9AGAR|nr:hypothetical protein BT96DRAFT_969673 [Gymnopus androsaceus JB14]